MKSVWAKVIVALALLVILSTVCSAFSVSNWFKKPTYAQTEVEKDSVLVFPFDLPMDADISENASIFTAVTVKNELQKTKKYSVLVFSSKLAPVQRAIEVDKIFPSEKQIESPYADDKGRTVEIARICAVDYAVIGVIEDYDFDSAAKSTSVLISLEVVEVKTGRTVSAYTSTGKSVAGSDIVDETELLQGAIIDSISKLNIDKESGIE